MENKDNFSACFPVNFQGLDHYPEDHQQQQQQQQIMRPQIGETSGDINNHQMVHYMLNNPHHHQQQQVPSMFGSSTSDLDKLSFADVMQFADFGPKLALNQAKLDQSGELEGGGGIDPVYFLKFPVLNENYEDHGMRGLDDDDDEEGEREEDEDEEDNATMVELGIVGDDHEKKKKKKRSFTEVNNKNKRKRARSVKTSEEVESQRMTHIAVERNRRKQMNEHLRVLRSLMPGSYVQRGDQASIIGGAIEFVRELEQLLQCLESQKRRRLYGDAAPQPPVEGNPNSMAIQQPQPPFLVPPLTPLDPNDHLISSTFDLGGFQEETAQSKSCLADVEVKLLGFDAMIKILSRRRPGQLIKLIAALEDLQLNILRTNITTIEQTVLYSFNIKVAGEVRYNAEDIASSVQQIFSFIYANGNI